MYYFDCLQGRIKRRKKESEVKKFRHIVEMTIFVPKPSLLLHSLIGLTRNLTAYPLRGFVKSKGNG